MDSIQYAGAFLSRLLVAYYRAPNHPTKMRIWHAIRGFQKNSRLQAPYCGGWITLDERDLLQRCILQNGFYEREVWTALSRHIQPGDCFWDVGAHIGTFAVAAVNDPRITSVHAFEPNPRTRAILTHNLELNRRAWQIHATAIGDANDTKELNLPPNDNTGLASLCDSFGGGSVSVETRSIDSLVFDDGLTPPRVMKIDVENWESHVLRGGRRLFAEFPPAAIALEAECDRSGAIASRDLKFLFDDLRFEVRHISRPDGHLESRENYLLTPKQP